MEKINEELEASTTKVFEAAEVCDNALEVKCRECNFTCMQTYDLKKHIKANHDKFLKKEYNVCGKTFMQNHEIESHLKTHSEIQPHSYSKWRLDKHIIGHKANRYCHYYNNQKCCPYDDLGCKFRHKVSALCWFSKCNKILCQFRHGEDHFVMKDIVGDQYDGELLETPVKYYPGCKECTDNSNCVNCILRNIRETDDDDM